MTREQKMAMAWSAAQSFIRMLKGYRNVLTTQQMRTLRGQALAGDINGAMEGLRRCLKEVRAV